MNSGDFCARFADKKPNEIMQAPIAIILCILLSVLEVARIHESIMIAQAIQLYVCGLGSAGMPTRKSKRRRYGEQKREEGTEEKTKDSR